MYQDHLGSPGAYEPLGLEYIASYATENDIQCELIEDYTIEPNALGQRIIDGKYNIVGISATTPAIKWALERAKEIKEYDPSVTIIFGGDHASAQPEIACEKNVDYVVIGEGEKAFVSLIKKIVKKDKIATIPGVAYANNEGKLQFTRPERITNLDVLPWPIRSIRILEKSRLYGLAYPAPSKQRAAAQMLFSRGCPRHCSFCACKSVFGKGARYRSEEEVIKEMLFLRDEYNVNLIYYSDLSFGANQQATEKLCNKIIESKIKISWYVTATAMDLTEKMTTIMSSAGCFKIAIGIESMHPETHHRIRPWSSVDAVKKAASAIDKAGMIVRGYYMIGIYGEKPDQFYNGIEQLCALPVDEIRFAFFTPFPGTTLYKKLRRFLITEDLTRFGSAEPILDFPAFSIEQQREAFDWALRRFYSGPEYSKRWRDKVKRFPKFEQSYQEFFSFLRDHDIKVF